MRFAPLTLALLVIAACGTPSKEPSEPQTPQPVLDGGAEAKVMPDFSLEDRNPSSQSFQTRVSPRAHEGEITGWYFSHAS